MGRVSSMEISYSQGLKKPPKISPQEEKNASQGLILRFFFNPRDEEIPIPETHSLFGNCNPVRVNQANFCFNCCHLTNF